MSTAQREAPKSGRGSWKKEGSDREAMQIKNDRDSTSQKSGEATEGISSRAERIGLYTSIFLFFFSHFSFFSAPTHLIHFYSLRTGKRSWPGELHTAWHLSTNIRHQHLQAGKILTYVTAFVVIRTGFKPCLMNDVFVGPFSIPHPLSLLTGSSSFLMIGRTKSA